MRRKTRPEISVVVVARNEGVHLHRTVDSFSRTLPPSSEIVVVDDGSDGSSESLPKDDGRSVRIIRSNGLGVAKARNFGAAAATGRVIVFADAHLELPLNWLEPLLEVIDNPLVGGVAPGIVNMEAPDHAGYGLRFMGPDLEVEWLPKPGNDPFQAPLIPWCATAMRRDVFDATGGFDAGMIRWGSIDNEMSVRLWLLGYELWIVPTVEVSHLFRSSRPYEVEWASVVHNLLRLAFVHWSERRIATVVDALRTHEAFPEAIVQMVAGDVATRREQLAARRVRDSEWWFERFGMD